MKVSPGGPLQTSIAHRAAPVQDHSPATGARSRARPGGVPRQMPEHVFLATAPMFVEIPGERAPHRLGAGNALVPAHLRQPLGLLIGERDGRPHDV